MNLATNTGDTSTSAGPPTPVGIDLCAAGVLTLCGLLGFRTVFGGFEWLIAGMIGMALGLCIAWQGARRRLDALVLGLLSVAAYFLASGFGDPERALAWVVPTPASLGSAAHAAVYGWTDLLGIVPPVGRSGGLLGVPLLCGLLATVFAGSAALRTRSLVFPLVPPLAVLVVSILLGTAEPAAAVLQGGLFVATALAWTAWRRRSDQAALVTRAGSGRVAGAGAMVLLSVLVAAGCHGLLPGVASERYVLREQLDPPFDPWVYPSPLSEFRSFTRFRGEQAPEACNGSDDVFTNVTGTEPGVPVRLAVLDNFDDGVAWRVASGAQRGSPSGVFERVGSNIRTESEGEARSLEFTVGCAYGNRQFVYIPTLGAPTSVRFLGDRAEALSDGLRVNRITGTALSTAYLETGDRVRMTVRMPTKAPLTEDQIKTGEPAAGPAPRSAPAGDTTLVIDALMDELLKGRERETPLAQLVALAQTLRGDSGTSSRSFGYSDGRDDTGSVVSLPGHSLYRLKSIACAVVSEGGCADAPRIAAYGNAEQYAALLALMGRQLGLPTRVVVGFCPNEQVPEIERGAADAAVCASEPNAGDSVRAQDVVAWTEVELEGQGWQPLVPTNRTDNTPRLNDPQPQNQDSEGQVPPASAQDGQTRAARQGKGDSSEKPPERSVDPFPWRTVALAALPFVVVGAVIGGILGLKARRRSRRRSRGAAAGFVAAWDEVTDLALDLGQPVAARSTRREAARVLGGSALAAVADETDAAVFGPGDPADGALERHWTLVDQARRELLQGRSRWGRMRARLNPASLLPSRHHPPAATNHRGDPAGFRRRTGRPAGPVAS